jgi:hypothetical protein
MGEAASDVRFGSEADMCSAQAHVRFTPNSDRESGHAVMVMSALPLKADMCGATACVRYGPIADIAGSDTTHSGSPASRNASLNDVASSGTQFTLGSQAP